MHNRAFVEITVTVTISKTNDLKDTDRHVNMY